MREMGEGVRRMFDSMRAHDLIDPEFRSEDESFAVRLGNRSVHSDEALRWLEAYRPFSLSRQEQQVILLGSHGRPVSPSQVMSALGMSDIDDYRVVYTNLQRKGLAYSKMAKSQVQNIARSSRRQPRDVARVMIRTPADALSIYEDLLGALRASASSFPLTRSTIGDVRLRLSPESAYASSDGSLLASLRALELIDDAGTPSAKLSADFRAYGIDVVSAMRERAESYPRQRSQAGRDAEDVFQELFNAANALGVELTLQTAGNRLRGQLGPAHYQELVSHGGLRSFVEAIGRFVVVEDYGRHVVQLTTDQGARN